MPQFEFSDRLKPVIADFKDRVWTDPTQVADPEGVQHHEFVSGNHGYKLDYDRIEEGTDFYVHWVSVFTRAMLEMYPHRKPDALVGTANGTNRVARDMAPLLGRGVVFLETEKVDSKTVQLTEEAKEKINEFNIKFAVEVEDVGTTGGTTSTGAVDTRNNGVRRIEVVSFHQRNPYLPKLDELRIPNRSVIWQPLDMYSPEKCPVEGFCAQGVRLIPHLR